MPSPTVLSSYTQPGPVTTLPADDPVIQAMLADLPTTIPELVQVVQGNILHIFWASRYGVEHNDEKKAEIQIRSAAHMLRHIHSLDPAPLTVARPHDQKLVGNCRDFSVLTVALLQRQGIPARARCGFGTYFTPGTYEDHWVVEYWNAEQNRWIMVDAQLDTFQQEQLNTDFDTLDVPHDRFLTGGHAWRMVREEGVDPDLFGIFDMRGLDFIMGDLLRDVAALFNLPLLPWDCWGLMLDEESAWASDENLAFLDRVAGLSLDNDQHDALRTLYETDERLRVPPVITSFDGGPAPSQITLHEVLGDVPA